MQNELLRLGQSAIQPDYHPLTGVYQVEGRPILVLWAPGGETRPYKARVNLAQGATEWAYYIRRQSSTVRAREPTNANCCPWPPPCRSMTATIRQRRWTISRGA